MVEKEETEEEAVAKCSVLLIVGRHATSSFAGRLMSEEGRAERSRKGREERVVLLFQDKIPATDIALLCYVYFISFHKEGSITVGDSLRYWLRGWDEKGPRDMFFCRGGDSVWPPLLVILFCFHVCLFPRRPLV